MKHIAYRPWYSDDRFAWIVYAIGVGAIFLVLWASFRFEGHGEVGEQMQRGWLMAKLLFGAGALALSGPVVVTIAQIVMGRRNALMGKKQKFADFEDF